MPYQLSREAVCVVVVVVVVVLYSKFELAGFESYDCGYSLCVCDGLREAMGL